MGQVLYEEGKYLVAYEDKQYELRVSDMVDESALKKAIGQEAEILLAEYAVAIRFPRIRIPCVLCYYHADPFSVVEGVSSMVRKGMLQGFLDEGLISQEVFDRQMGTM